MVLIETLIINRFETSDQGTFGKILVGEKWLYTGELPWRENKNNISCVPCGTYKCIFTFSPRFKRVMCLIIDNSKKRLGLRVHSANYMGDKDKGYLSQLNGCISLGEKFGILNGQKAVVISSPAIRYFESLYKNKIFNLEIKQCYQQS